MRTSHIRRAALLSLALALSGVASPARQRRDVSREPARASREWVRDAVVYEIFPRAFSPEGNFDGVTRDLDRLKNLGVTVLWLMPIHPVGQARKKGGPNSPGSPYAVRDYYATNPDYGTKEDFRRLVEEAHRRGLRVIIDVVANHTAWDSVLMGRPEFYTKDAAGRIVAPDPGWSDVADLDYSNPAVRDYMIEMLKYWLREFKLDGFRCDVSWMVPTDFWERARAELERINPDIMLLSEADEPGHMLRAFDLDYGWPLFHAIDDAARGEAPATRLRETWERERARNPRGALRLNFTDNHDERRAVARLGERGAVAASVFVFTIDGVPLIYNGMEVGDTMESGDPALFERFPVFWPIVKRNPGLPDFYRRLVALRRAHAALRQGELHWLRNSDEARVVTFLRRARGEEFVVAVNFSTQPFAGTVETAGEGFADVTPALDTSQGPAAPVGPRTAALPALALEPWGFRVFRRAAR
jgi:cyclomaltodextrinase / maltogenic alpha-amylase / neopullulanase